MEKKEEYKNSGPSSDKEENVTMATEANDDVPMQEEAPKGSTEQRKGCCGGCFARLFRRRKASKSEEKSEPSAETESPSTLPAEESPAGDAIVAAENDKPNDVTSEAPDGHVEPVVSEIAGHTMDQEDSHDGSNMEDSNSANENRSSKIVRAEEVGRPTSLFIQKGINDMENVQAGDDESVLSDDDESIEEGKALRPEDHPEEQEAPTTEDNFQEVIETTETFQADSSVAEAAQPPNEDSVADSAAQTQEEETSITEEPSQPPIEDSVANSSAQMQEEEETPTSEEPSQQEVESSEIVHTDEPLAEAAQPQANDHEDNSPSEMSVDGVNDAPLEEPIEPAEIDEAVKKPEEEVVTENMEMQNPIEDSTSLTEEAPAGMMERAAAVEEENIADKIHENIPSVVANEFVPPSVPSEADQEKEEEQEVVHAEEHVPIPQEENSLELPSDDLAPANVSISDEEGNITEEPEHEESLEEILKEGPPDDEEESLEEFLKEEPSVSTEAAPQKEEEGVKIEEMASEEEAVAEAELDQKSSSPIVEEVNDSVEEASSVVEGNVAGNEEPLQQSEENVTIPPDPTMHEEHDGEAVTADEAMNSEEKKSHPEAVPK